MLSLLRLEIISVENGCGIPVARKPAVVGTADAKPVLEVEIGKCTSPGEFIVHQHPGTHPASHPDLDKDWVACHDINPQWAIRNSTGIYLKKLAEDEVFPAKVNERLLAAATQYRAAYESWQAFYSLLGHNTSERARTMKARRLAGAAIVRAWLAHEKAALDEVEKALSLLA